MRALTLAAAMALFTMGAAQAQTPPKGDPGAPLPPDPAPPAAEAVRPGVWLIPGGILPNRQPDGNTVILEGKDGLVVIDTGRHRWHRKAIIDFARGHGGVAAILNSHWHLDHVSGNKDVQRAWPKARIHASRAVDQALTGFIPQSAEGGRKYLADGGLPPESVDDLKGDLATIDNGASIQPDVYVEASAAMTLGGRKLQVNVARDGTTAADLWIYDPSSRTAVVGDLVTLPAPFMDTACPDGWSAALDAVWATPFETAIPGHGRPMTRAQFDTYRKGFTALVDCAAGARDKAGCAADWARVVEALGGDDRDRKRGAGMAAYYVQDVLRANGGKSKVCRTGAG